MPPVTLEGFHQVVTELTRLLTEATSPAGLQKEEDGNCLLLGHNVYSVVLFQLIGTILSAFVRLKK